jgi:hypothetical protein
VGALSVDTSCEKGGARRSEGDDAPRGVSAGGGEGDLRGDDVDVFFAIVIGEVGGLGAAGSSR